MTIRSKLLLSYSIMLAAIVAVSLVSIWAIKRWQNAAEQLTQLRSQVLRAETLRRQMDDQISDGLDFLSGMEGSGDRFTALHESVSEAIQELREFSLSETESDHIEGLEESHVELTWIGQRLFKRLQDSVEQAGLIEARTRLWEIADEVTDDVAALVQYYQAEEERRIDEASDAGRLAALVIMVMVLIALGLLWAMMFLVRQWLVKPIAVVNDATHTISTGNLDVEVNWRKEDEWGALAKSINEMARSLKSLQEELRQQERLAALGEIAAYTAHNLRNPLAGIRAAAQVMLSELPEGDESGRDTLREMVTTIDRMDTWMKGLLGLAKPTDLKLEQITFNELVDEVAGIVSSHFGDSGTKLELHLSSDLPPGRIDPSLFQQAVAVVLTNAYEAGSSQIAVSTGYESDGSRGGCFSLLISDNGCGVPAELQGKLFKVFATSKVSGNGLGLAQAKKIVELHGGTIELVSEPGKGTDVTLTLPVSRENDTNTTDSE